LTKYSCKYVLNGRDYSSEGFLAGTVEEIKKSIEKKFNKYLKLSSNIEFGILACRGEFTSTEVAGIIVNLKDLKIYVSKIEHGFEEIEYLIDSTFAIDSYNKLKV
jgi:hypothetical protein